MDANKLQKGGQASKSTANATINFDPNTNPLRVGEDYASRSSPSSITMDTAHIRDTRTLSTLSGILDPKDPITYAQPFINFLSDNPTVYHAVQATKERLIRASSFELLHERSYPWNLKPGHSYVVTRNDSSLVAFTVGGKYKPGNGIAMIAGHVDALTARVKPYPKLDSNEKDGTGFERLGVAPYAGGLNQTWWDRDLGIAGRVMVKDKGKVGKVVQKLVNLKGPIARIPTLAPHFGQISQGPFNPETQMVPIVGLETSDSDKALGDAGTFAATQPPRLVKAVSQDLGTQDCEYLRKRWGVYRKLMISFYRQ